MINTSIIQVEMDEIVLFIVAYGVDELQGELLPVSIQHGLPGWLFLISIPMACAQVGLTHSNATIDKEGLNAVPPGLPATA